MSVDQQIQESIQFVEICVRLKLLNGTEAESLRQLVLKERCLAAHEAIQRGWVTSADVEIVQSLQHPTDIVPGYEILDLVGRGGMGAVYRARQIDLDRVIALKTILINSLSGETTTARFEREAKALARLQHPNIVQALNFGQHHGRYYFAMEYVSGQTCEQLVLERGRLSPAQVWPLLRQVASGLMHALRQGLIHRDIKPANLIVMAPPEGAVGTVSNHGIVKITDFGLAMFTEQTPDKLKLTTGDKILGSPAFMSPEQFAGKVADFRTDMYSLGATAWNLLFGAPPFRGGSVAALYQEKLKPLVVSDDLPIQLPVNQWQLLMGLLDPDLEKRPASYEMLIDAIDRLGVIDDTTETTELTGSAMQESLLSISEQPTLTSEPLVTSGDSAEKTTVHLTLQHLMGKITRHRWWMAVAVIGCMGIGFFLLQPEPRGPRKFLRVLSSQPLYDGLTLAGWDVGGSMMGAWNTFRAPDASMAIACTTRQGAVTRPLPKVTNPRISLFVWLQPNSGAVDIDFGFNPNSVSSRRGCLRLNPSAAELGIKNNDFGELKTIERRKTPVTMLDRYHVVNIELQASDWYVFLEEQLIGTIPANRVAGCEAFRLVVHDSPDNEIESPQAYFSDFQLIDLAEFD